MSTTRSISAFDKLKLIILSLQYTNSIYADNLKDVINDLVNLSGEADANNELPESWFWALSHIREALYGTECSVCNDVPYFKWLRNLHYYFVNSTFGITIPKMPTCADCRKST